jgi:hypothetical protein
MVKPDCTAREASRERLADRLRRTGRDEKRENRRASQYLYPVTMAWSSLFCVAWFRETNDEPQIENRSKPKCMKANKAIPCESTINPTKNQASGKSATGHLVPMGQDGEKIALQHRPAPHTL